MSKSVFYGILMACVMLGAAALNAQTIEPSKIPIPKTVATITGDQMTTYGVKVDRGAVWSQFGGNLLTNFGNMYNLHVIKVDDDQAYPYHGWFFGWAVEDCNPGYSGCDAIYAVRAPKLEGPWEIYAGDNNWDTTMNAALWVPVVTAQDEIYDSWHNGDPSVVRVNKRYYMAYSATGFNADRIPYGSEGDTDSDISCVMGATSEDGIHWTPTSAPIMIDPDNIGQAPIEPGGYTHPKGLYHRPSLMYEAKENNTHVWKLWFDAYDGIQAVALYAENERDFDNPDDWKILRGLDNPAIREFPNPDVVKVDDVYFGYGDPGGYDLIPEVEGEEPNPQRGWSGRKTCELMSLNGMDWIGLGYIEPDPGAQSNQIPEGYVERDADGKVWMYLSYATQRMRDYKYDTVRMKRREITDKELEMLRKIWHQTFPNAEER